MKEQFEQPSFEYVYIEGWFRACKSGGGAKEQETGTSTGCSGQSGQKRDTSMAACSQ